MNIKIDSGKKLQMLMVMSDLTPLSIDACDAIVENDEFDGDSITIEEVYTYYHECNFEAALKILDLDPNEYEDAPLKSFADIVYKDGWVCCLGDGIALINTHHLRDRG